MVETTRPSETSKPSETTRLARFDGAERVLHWVNATLFLILMTTAAILYVGPLSAAVGRREFIRQVHVWCGLALPVPLLVVLLSRWGSALRADVTRLNRWSADDRRWLRSLARDPYVELGKFNPGQKLNAAFTAGAMVVMIMTGVIMKWFEPFPVDWRTGATFVHDWTAVAIFVVVIGHIGAAFSDPDALSGMVRGTVSRRWAKTHRPRWYEEVAGVDGVEPQKTSA